MFTQWALRPDSAGAGTHRGGLGAVYEIEALADAEVALLGERGKYPPFGVAGGAAGALNRFSWGPGGVGNTPPLASKVADVRIRAGERVRLETPGGGGWGEPRDRDRHRVARDVRLGYVGAAGARETYEVVLAADDCVDEQPTALRDRNDA